MGSEDQFINTISNDILKNSSPINYINYEYIDNATNKLSSLFPKYNFKNCSVQLVNENNKCKLVINTNSQEIKVPLPYNLTTENKNFSLSPYLNELLTNIYKPEDINNNDPTLKATIANKLNLNASDFDVYFFPVTDGDYQTKLPVDSYNSYGMEVMYNLVLVLKNKYIIKNNHLMNEYYICSNLDTDIGFPVSTNPNDYLDFYEFAHNVMKWPVKDLYDNDDNKMWKICDKWGETYYLDWWSNKLSRADFTNLQWRSDLYCDTEIQALTMYTVEWGDFWNYYLHHQESYVTKNHKMQGNFCDGQTKKIRFDDYKLVSSALSKAPSWPTNLVVYHGVEYMEQEFYDQLKNYIVENGNGTYDYSKCIGKEITTYGFISTTFEKYHALDYCTGNIWTTDTNQINELFPNGYDKNNLNYLPLKSYAAFKINIPKGSKNLAYVSGMPGANGYENPERQVLIDRNTRFRIDNVHTEKNSLNQLVTVFDVTYIGK